MAPDSRMRKNCIIYQSKIMLIVTLLIKAIVIIRCIQNITRIPNLSWIDMMMTRNLTTLVQIKILSKKFRSNKDQKQLCKNVRNLTMINVRTLSERAIFTHTSSLTQILGIQSIPRSKNKLMHQFSAPKDYACCKKTSTKLKTGWMDCVILISQAQIPCQTTQALLMMAWCLLLDSQKDRKTL